MSEDSLWTCTPPLSPPLQDSNKGEEKGEFVQHGWFVCSGDSYQTNVKLNPDSFLMMGELESIKDYTKLWRNLKNPIFLFDRKFDKDAAILFQGKLLFQMARKDLMILDSASRLNSHLIKNVSAAMQDDKDYMQLRKQLCEFMAYICSYIARVLMDENCVWVIDKIIPSLSDNLFSLRLLLRSLKDLPDFVIAHSSSSLGNKCSHASYHLFHVHLDLRWYHLMTLYQLAKCQKLSITLDDMQQSSQDHKLADIKSLEEHLLHLLSDLVAIAIDKFERIQLNAIMKRTPFSCTCVRELWLMLQLFISKYLECSKSFWDCLNQLLDVVLGKKSSNNVQNCNCSKISLPESYTCSDRVTFCVWLLLHVSQLNGYTEDGEFVGVISGRVESNYPQLEAVLKSCATAESNITEPQLRVIIRLMIPLLIEWWEPRSEPIMILWEYYHRRLNSPFFVPGSTPDTVAIMSKTGAGLLEQVKSRLEATSLQDDDSYSIFLCLLGKHLVRTSSSNQQRHWQQMRGRIYSKFSPTKLLALTELGLYHFVSVFLTLAVTVDVQEVGKKLQDLLSILPLESIDLNRQHVMLKANIALVHLFVEKGMDITEVSRPIQLILMQLCTHKSGNTLALIRTYVEGIQDIIDISQSLHLSQHSLLGSWITHYLSNGKVTDSCRLMDTIITIMAKLRQSLNCNMSDTSNSNQSKVMIDLLIQYFLPYVQTQCNSIGAQPPFQVADLAASFTLLALEQPDFQTQSFDQLFTYFVSSEKMNVSLTKRYLCHILLEEAVMKMIVEQTNVENIVIQAWIRCSLLSVNESSEELSDLSRIINRLPAVQDLCQTTTISLADIDDPLFTFIKLAGTKYKNMQDIHRKALFRERYQLYFMQVDKCVASVVNCSTSSQELVSRIYVCTACMVHHCGQILYIKSKPNCLLPSLLNLLLLPHSVYRVETQLHPFISVGIRKTLHQFIFGLSKLNPKQDDFIARILRDLITVYLIKLSKTGNSMNMQGQFITHPLLKCFTGCEELEIGRFVLETISNKFFSFRGNIPQEQATLAFGFLMDLINVKKSNNDFIDQIINCSLLKIFELIMFAEEGRVAKRQGLEVVKMVTSCDVFKENTQHRESFISIFMTLCQKHVAFSSTHLFKLTKCLAQLCPDLIRRCFPLFTDLIKTVEQRRGVGYDPGLRNDLEKLSVTLGMQDT